MKRSAVAARFSVSPSYVSKVGARLRQTGQATPGPQHNHVRPRLEPFYDVLRARVAAQADAMIAELRTWMAEQHGVTVSHPVMWETLGRTRPDAEKKRLRAAEQERPDIAAARAAWIAQQAKLACAQLIFLDETWATTNMARSHGRAPCGERLVAPVPYGHWHTTTFLCGLRQNGLVAPLVLDGAINREAFLAYIEQMLCPTLRVGDIVICDNLRSHKVSGVREAIKACGAALLYLPPYSPDLNPIELAFSKLKRAAARTVDALWATVGQLISNFTANECANYLRHCGYSHSRR